MGAAEESAADAETCRDGNVWQLCGSPGSEANERRNKVMSAEEDAEILQQALMINHMSSFLLSRTLPWGAILLLRRGPSQPSLMHACIFRLVLSRYQS